MAEQNPEDISGDELDALMAQFNEGGVGEAVGAMPEPFASAPTEPAEAAPQAAAGGASPGEVAAAEASLSDEISVDELAALGFDVTSAPSPPPAPPPAAAAPPPPEPPEAPKAAPPTAGAETKLPNLTAEENVTPDAGIGLLMDVPLRVSIELGRISMTLQQVLALGRGSIIELERLAGEPVDILVNDKLIGRGEVVVIDEYFGVKITELIDPKG